MCKIPRSSSRLSSLAFRWFSSLPGINKAAFKKLPARVPGFAGGSILAVLFLAGLGLAPAPGAVRLSEFLADNADVIQDDDGVKSDYIEIYNPEDGPVNLAGYSLTVDKARPRLWVFPAITLERGQYLLVWASGNNRTDPAKPLHTNFKLEKSGGYLALIPPDTVTPVTAYDPYPPQVADKSYGLYQPEIRTKIVPEGAACRWLVPQSDFVKWRAPDYNDSAWHTGVTGIGFDTSTPGLDYSVYFGAGGNVELAMLNQATSCYVRLPFQMTDLKGLSSMRLGVRYDDGYVAGLNATTVAQGNAPAPVHYNSQPMASATRRRRCRWRKRT